MALYQGKKPITLEWTKGILLDKHVELAEFYEFKTIDGHDYLFIEWKSGDYVFGGHTPKYYVFKRGSYKAYPCWVYVTKPSSMVCSPSDWVSVESAETRGF